MTTTDPLLALPSLENPISGILCAFHSFQYEAELPWPRWAGIVGISMTSGLQLIPDGHAYAFVHGQDIGDLLGRGTCMVGFGGTDEDGQDFSEEDRWTVGQAVFRALEVEGFEPTWSSNAAHRIQIDIRSDEEKAQAQQEVG